MSTKAFDLEAEIARLTKDFSKSLAGVSSSDFIRDGVVKEAISSVIWDVYHALPDQREALAEVLEEMPDIIRKAAREDAGLAEPAVPDAANA